MIMGICSLPEEGELNRFCNICVFFYWAISLGRMNVPFPDYIKIFQGFNYFPLAVP